MHTPPTSEEPGDITDRVRAVERIIRRNVVGILISGGVVVTSGSGCILSFLIHQYESAATFGGSCFMSLSAAREFLFSINAGQERINELIRSHFRR